MSKIIFVLGAGGHAKVLIATLHALGQSIQGVIEKSSSLIGKTILNETIVSEDVLGAYDPSSVWLVNAIGSTASLQLRRAIFNRYKALGYVFLSVIHPHAYLAEDVEYGEGSQIMAGCVIQPGCRIGENVILNTKSSIDHDCVIGSHVHVAPGVTLSGGVTVGDDSHIGTGVTVIQNIEIGSNCLVAAGSVVTKSVVSHSKVAGIPAKVLVHEAA